MPGNRVWGFSVKAKKTHRSNRLQSPQPRWKSRATITKTASGIPLSPSRDPIEEGGGVHLSAFVVNDGINWAGDLGLRKTRNCKTETVQFDYNHSPMLSASGVGVTVDGGFSARLQSEKKVFEECCSDGDWVEKREYSYKAGSGAGSLCVIGGAYFRGSSGAISVDASAGVKAEGGLELNILVQSGYIIVGGCNDEIELATFLVKVDGEVSIEGGFDAAVWVKCWSFSLVRGVIGGEISGTGAIELVYGLSLSVENRDVAERQSLLFRVIFMVKSVLLGIAIRRVF
ncbi:hypothetical protein [Roseibacillus ishigakijimensis]|uniref:Uncharacterized protein n=1 Tax=Roseibacillus ishigakijimensis TaxID=454146 RepID=A0A934RVD0_9BACT|nr:hypothetical protein [Roseibacillus ishigakijimensis]MBK1835689.1 hypothetical protein [Roseibacillus ishigakijimensis]